MEGAGVKLKRVFGPREIPRFDPFLLLDHFGSNNPQDYIKGFPWHPHRGIETVTYMIRGEVEHGDSLGNKGVIRSGDIQWMTAGSGIIHQEMPQPFDGDMMGFQLWVNLPRAQKMTEPRYRSITQHDVFTTRKDDATIKIIAGTVENQKGPVSDLSVDVEYFDIQLNGHLTYSTSKMIAFLYVYAGAVNLGDFKVPSQHSTVLDQTDHVQLTGNANFLLIAGNPLNEPISWGGPIVMNTQEELVTAFQELNDGTFIKGKNPSDVAEHFYR
jgi:redox-sensitive bicupin YhaK (pirin superfamily)